MGSPLARQSSDQRPARQSSEQNQACRQAWVANRRQAWVVACLLVLRLVVVVVRRPQVASRAYSPQVGERSAAGFRLVGHCRLCRFCHTLAIPDLSAAIFSASGVARSGTFETWSATSCSSASASGSGNVGEMGCGAERGFCAWRGSCAFGMGSFAALMGFVYGCDCGGHGCGDFCCGVGPCRHGDLSHPDRGHHDLRPSSSFGAACH